MVTQCLMSVKSDPKWVLFGVALDVYMLILHEQDTVFRGVPLQNTKKVVFWWCFWVQN